MKLSTIQQTLKEIGREPTRSLGQNFLHDQNLADWIVAQLAIKPGEAWVELGPGLGALTEYALQRSTNGLVIEKDGKLADFLRGRFLDLDVVHGDASEFDVRELFTRGPVKVLGNLPYYVSSQILFQFTADPSPVRSLVFTLQKELAERLSAGPRTKAYGALTLLIGRRWQVKYLRTLPGSVFMPAPSIDSAVVLLTPRSRAELPECDGERFRSLVKQGFAQRRKQLRKNLASYGVDWPALCTHLGVEETTRAEELSLEQWIALTNFVSGVDSTSDSASAAQDVHGEMFDVVNESDEVTGQLSRHEVHRQKLRHRAVHIFVFNAAGELFLQKRSQWKDVHPLRWDSSAAGHVNTGQDYDETAPRELLEELGVSAPCELVGRITARPETGWEFVQLYRAEHAGPFSLHPAEIESGSFFHLEQIARWTEARPQDFATGFLECWKLFRDSHPAQAGAPVP
ncbi:MAG TPA: 16S rRNA (adenine(1518)-N(6)/adenine(1519)-N(6))-dimethyltransferase RsmA [Chthoniobacteraceae bacterium]|jgi:16S rRNA (adenine1518-N6/adenine1519-N6)-dimethyltransferase